jgi:hypothetical protein
MPRAGIHGTLSIIWNPVELGLKFIQINKEIMNVGIDVHKAIYWELLATDASSPWVSIMKRHPTNGRKVTNDKTGHAFVITLIFYRVEKP